jgi:hypothetical protein
MWAFFAVVTANHRSRAFVQGAAVVNPISGRAPGKPTPTARSPHDYGGLNPQNSSLLVQSPASFDATGPPVGTTTVDSIPRDARIEDLLVILIVALRSRRLSSEIAAL